jgi:hypothetical protein
MHILMLLAREDPSEAHALCRALREHVAQDEIWVYYKKAPIVPILRQADLHNAGCTIELPASSLTAAEAGQQAWIAAAQLVRRLTTTGGAPPQQSEVAGLLKTLSRGNFALVRQSPPLLYHNDLTASVRRFYWSEDLGCALWLRLYFENERLRSHRNPA